MKTTYCHPERSRRAAERMRGLAAIVIVSFLTACGGGGTTPATHGGSGSGTNGAKTAPVSMTIKFNATSGTAARHRQYVSRATKGVGVFFQAHDPATLPTTEAALATPTFATQVGVGHVGQNVSCTADLGNGAFDCTLLIAAPVGDDDIQITTWDAAPNTDGYGGNFSAVGDNDLSTNVLSNQLVLQDETNQFNLALDGVLASVYLSIAPAQALSGSAPQTLTLNVSGKDADGDVIIGSQPYVDSGGNPVQINLNAASVTAPTTPLEYVELTCTDGTPGETTPSAESSTALPYGGSITVLPPTCTGGTPTGYNVYGAAASGQERKLNGSPIALTSNYSITANTDNGAPPATNTTTGVNPPSVVVLASVSGATLPISTSVLTAPPVTQPTVSYNGDDAASASFSGFVSLVSTPTVNNGDPVNTSTLSFTRSIGGPIDISGNPTVNSYPVSFGAVDGLVSGTNNDLWAVGDGIIADVSTSGSVIHSSTPSAFPIGITFGSDGNLWAADSANNAILLINPADATSTSYASGITGTGLWDITLGADGNLYFTERATCESGAGYCIGRVTPARNGANSPTITEQLLGTPVNQSSHLGTGSEGIVTGPDGNLWFTETNGYVGTIDTNFDPSSFKEYATGTGRADWIASAPDGNLWVSDTGHDKIIVMNTSGTVVNTISVPYTPNKLTVGPDGNVWIACTQGAILRISTDGSYTQSSVTAGVVGAPYAIATGPDKNMWFTDTVGSHVEMIQLNVNTGP